MRVVLILIFVLSILSCGTKEEIVKPSFSEVNIEILYKDSISIRAIDIYRDSLVGFGFNKGYGFLDLKTNTVELKEYTINETVDSSENWITEHRAVTFVDNSFYSLGISSPARLRKVNIENKEEKLVYEEHHKKAFYDAIAFWNDKEGIAMGDPTDGCLSVIITRDGGNSWQKVSCENLPETAEGEAAFAASNGNIAIKDEHTWIVSGGMKSRVFYSPDKGKTWMVTDTPIIQGQPTTGAYSMAFFDAVNGVIYGGDYTQPEDNKANKAITKDGGKTWTLVADGSGAGYKSCVRYIPNGKGEEMVVVGFTGISISNDRGASWKELSKEGFYTLRFLTDNTAIAAGKGRIAKLTFK